MRIKVISDLEASFNILQDKDRFVCYLGAGASAEAGVKMAYAICDDILADLEKFDPLFETNREQARKRTEAKLNWQDKTRRYSTCMHIGRNTKDSRVGYLLKLHGDYDTENVLNTGEETITISKKMTEKVRTLSRRSGMVVLGTAGHEESVHTLFKSLTDDSSQAENVLSLGLLWGVYVPGSKPSEPLGERELEDLIMGQIDKGEVGQGIVEMMKRTSKRDEPFCFFPVWGAGNFMSTLIAATQDRELKGTAELFLDREMRLRTVFKRAELTEEAISTHIDNLRARERELRYDRQTSNAPAQKPRPIFKARDKQMKLEIRATYGDIASRSMMSSPEFQSVRRAVVSADDTCLSAGGGVARALLRKAGHHMVLNELQKFSPPVDHCTVAVTSGGNLPVNYIFHVRLDGNRS